MIGPVGVVSAETAAKLLMVTPRYLSLLVKQGWIKKTPDDKYTIVAAVQGYITSLKDTTRRNSSKAASTTLADRRAELVSVQVEERTGDLKREAIAEAMAAVDGVIGGMKADLYSVPARVTMDLRLRKKIEAEIERVFQAASERTRHQEADDEPDSELVDAGSEAGA